MSYSTYTEEQRKELRDELEKIVASHGSVQVVAALSDLFAADGRITGYECNRKAFRQQAQILRDAVAQIEPIVKYKVEDIYGPTITEPSKRRAKPRK